MRKLKVANKNHAESNRHLLASMMSQLQAQSKELELAKNKLERASRSLEQKNKIIDSLELDLEHMVDQLLKLNATESSSRWINRPVPGLNTENSRVVV